MSRRKPRRRRKNITREQWVDTIIDGIAESEGVDGVDVDLTEEIEEQIEAYTEAVDEAVAKCSRFFPPAQPIEIDEDVYLDIYRTLEESGSGIRDAWDTTYYPHLTRAQWDDLARCYKAKLSRFVDFTGGGSLVDAIRNAVYDQKPETDEGDDEETVVVDDHLGGGLEVQLEEINRHRRRLHMPELDVRRSGWTPDDIRAEYTRVRTLNPDLRAALLSWEA